MDTAAERQFLQTAALPVRIVDERFEVLLITSKKRKKWIIPKGDVQDGLSPAESAAEEAYEEAGVVGAVSLNPLGTYSHSKTSSTKRVRVYLLAVIEQHDQWPEEDYRVRAWFALDEACKRIRHDDLIDLIQSTPSVFESLRKRHITPVVLRTQMEVEELVDQDVDQADAERDWIC